MAEVVVDAGTGPERGEGVREAVVAEAILAYLSEHPLAADTLEGVAEWWLLRRRLREEVGRVARVLDRLVEAGLVERVGTGPACRYRLPRRGAGEGQRRAS